jgi:hypothetical protein
MADLFGRERQRVNQLPHRLSMILRSRRFVIHCHCSIGVRRDALSRGAGQEWIDKGLRRPSTVLLSRHAAS